MNFYPLGCLAELQVPSRNSNILLPVHLCTDFKMFDVNAVLLVVSAILLLFTFLRRNQSSEAGKRFPPSIPSLPLLGSIPFFTGSLETLPIFFMRKAEQLGPIIQFYAGRKLAVSLNGKEAIVNALQRHAEAYADRPDFWTEANILNPDLRGIAFTHYNETSKYYRKLTLSILKEFGYGISREMDIRIGHEIESLITKIRNYNGCAFDPKAALMYASSNIVMTMLFGSESQAGINHSQIIDDSNEFIDNIDARIDYAPFIRFLPSYRKKIANLVSSQKRMMDQIEMAIEHNKRNPSEKNFVSRFIEIEGPNYSHQDLIYILRDMCMDSAGIVEATLRWALLELANHPKIQSRLQTEIDQVYADNRLPSIYDKQRLPFLEAVNCEGMRRHTLATNPVGRLTSKETTICGYVIPRGCLAISNIYGVHMDPKVWGDPENFRPERFLDKDDNIIRRNDIIPFNVGKRSCIGEVIARQELFMFLVSLVQHFDIQPPEGQNFVTANEIPGLIVVASPFKIRLIPRIKL